HAGALRLVGKRRIQGGVVNVVALNALVEQAHARTYDRLSVSTDVPVEAQARLPGLVEVLHHAAREAVHACFSHAVEVELLTVGAAPLGIATERGQLSRIDGSIRGDGVAQRRVVIRGNEVGELVVTFE